MELRQLKSFVAVIERKSFSAAAAALFISRQSLSKSIANLEDELGVSLLLRTAEGVALTEIGQRFYERTKLILQELDELSTEMVNNGVHGARKFRLGFTQGAFNTISEESLRRVRDLYPGVELEISHFSDKLCEDKVISGELDMACCSGPIIDPALSSVLFLRSRLYIFMHKYHRLAKKPELSLQDIQAEPFDLVSNDFRVLQDFIDQCGLYGFHPVISHMASDTSFINCQVMKQKGVSLIPECLIGSIPNPEFVYKKFPLENCEWKLHLIFLKKQNLSPFGKAVMLQVFGVQGP